MNDATNLLANTYSASSPGVNAASMLGFFSVLIIPLLVALLVVVVSNWVIFQKAGRRGWEAIIPLYNLYVMLLIVGLPGWWVLVMIGAGFIPVVGGIFNLCFGI